MKICFVSDAGSYHTKKWCKWFYEQGHEISVISFTPGVIENAEVIIIETGANSRGNDLGKLKYFLAISKMRQAIQEINPDIINVHYATSYGTIVALSGIKGYVLSVWGADVYDFPQKSFMHRSLLKYSLNNAKYLFSTSQAMAVETKKYTSKEITVTPFGVDMNLFNPNKRKRAKDDNRFIIGTIKTLTPKYGIDYLIKALSIVSQKRPDIPIELRIAGKGENAEEYKMLAQSCNISHITKWLGYISQEEAANEWANMDLAIVYSTLDSESFGVSAVEAEACGCPVIISDIPGLMEATLPGETSIVIKRKNERLLADAIIDLFDNKEFRTKLGEQGRTFVEQKYDVQKCFENVEKIFEDINAKNGLVSGSKRVKV